MAVEYLGKKRMYELLKQYCNKSICNMKNSQYQKYRGTEWISANTADYNNVKLCSMGRGLWLHLVEKDYDGDVVRDEVVQLAEM